MQRVNRILGHVGSNKEVKAEQNKTGKFDKKTGNNSLSVRDNRTGKEYELNIWNGVVQCKQFWNMTGDGVSGIRAYDPGMTNTANVTSRITFINGQEGKLRYRGYPIEQLAEKSTFLEVAYLLLYGELPDSQQYNYWNSRVMNHSYVHQDLKTLMHSFRYDAHPMGMIVSAIAALGTFHPEANPALQGQGVYDDVKLRNKQIHRLVGSITTIAAFAYRHRTGRPLVDPRNDLGYTENFLYMLDCLSDASYRPHPKLARALDVLFILHADHEQNCSTAAMRHLTSSGVDVYSAIAGANAALYGPRHGGANEAVVRMLMKIGSKDNIPQFIENVKAKKIKLMGFGHRVYKNYDPRARIVKKIAHEVFAILGKEPLIEVAVELERIALSDEYFKARSLYPNVDFYSGLIYKAMGFPTDFFVVLFAIPRTVGWLANWMEFLDDPENRIVRPRQVYVGAGDRDYIPMGGRVADRTHDLISRQSNQSKRRNASKSTL